MSTILMPTGARREHVQLRKGTGRETSLRPIAFGCALSKRVAADARPRDAYGMESLDDYWGDEPPAVPHATPAAEPAAAKTPAAGLRAAPVSATKGLPTGVMAKARGYVAAGEGTPTAAAAAPDAAAAAPFGRKPPGGLLLARTPVSKAAASASRGAAGAGTPASGAAAKPSASSSRHSSRRAGASAERGGAPGGGLGGYLLARTPLSKAAGGEQSEAQGGMDGLDPGGNAAAVASLLEAAAAEAAGGAQPEATAEEGGEQGAQLQEGTDMCTQFPTPGAPLLAAAAGQPSPPAPPSFAGADAEVAAEGGDDDDDEGDFGGAHDEMAGCEDEDEEAGAAAVGERAHDAAAESSDEGSGEEEEEDEDEEPPTPTLTADGARAPARMSVDEAEAARAHKQRLGAAPSGSRKRRRRADASCIHPSLAELEAKEAAERAAQLPGEGSRHSRRRKMPVLEFWRNERVLYGRRQSAKFAAIVDVQLAAEEEAHQPRRRAPQPKADGPERKAAPKAKPPAKPAASAAAPSVAGGPRSLSGFVVFSAEQRSVLKAQQPALSFGELGKRLGELWGALPQADKEAYARKGQRAAVEPPAAGAARPALAERAQPPHGAGPNRPAAPAPAPPAGKRPQAKVSYAEEDDEDEEEPEVLPLSKRMAARH